MMNRLTDAELNQELSYREQDGSPAQTMCYRALKELRELRKNAAEDTKRLDWLESKSNGDDWIARESSTGRGYRVHNTREEPGTKKTIREAIDAVMSAEEGNRNG